MTASGTGVPRTYDDIANDTASGDVNESVLTQEIADESSITTALDYINRAANQLDVYFVSALSAPEITALDAVVAAHTGVAVSLAFRFKEVNGAQTTTLETFQNAATLTPLVGLAKGPYKLSWTCELRVTVSGSLDSRVAVRFQVDGSSKSNTASNSTLWQCHSGWDRYFANANEKPALTLDYRRDPGLGGDDTVEIRKVRLGIERLEE